MTKITMNICSAISHDQEQHKFDTMINSVMELTIISQERNWSSVRGVEEQEVWNWRSLRRVQEGAKKLNLIFYEAQKTKLDFLRVDFLRVVACIFFLVKHTLNFAINFPSNTLNFCDLFSIKARGNSKGQHVYKNDYTITTVESWGTEAQ